MEAREVVGFSEQLVSLIAEGDQLPTLPHVVFELHDVLNNEMAGQRAVAAVIERDPALTARLLRAANSSAFCRGLEHRVANVLGAIQRLGVNQVRALCQVLAVVNVFGGRRRGLSHRAFWAHSVSVGMVARLLWTRARPDAVMSPEDMYVAGLLHDLGLLVLDQFFPSAFDQVAAEATHALSVGLRPLANVEREVLGMDHGEVGARLLERWELPLGIVESVRWHHRHDEAPEKLRRACGIVAAAEIICSRQGWGLKEEGPAALSPEVALASLGLPDSLVEELLIELEPVGEQAAGVIG